MSPTKTKSRPKRLPRLVEAKPAKKVPASSLASLNDKQYGGWKVRLRKMAGKREMSARDLSRATGSENSMNYTMGKAEDVALDTLRKAANALNVPLGWLATGSAVVVGVDVEDPDEAGTIRLVPIFTAADAEDTKPSSNNGMIALIAHHSNVSARALRVTDDAMQADGLNQPVIPQKVIVPGDVVVWAHGASAQVGDLVVARTPRGAVVRLLVQNDRGDFQLQANNAAFARVNVKPTDLLGPLIGLHRQIGQR